MGVLKLKLWIHSRRCNRDNLSAISIMSDKEFITEFNLNEFFIDNQHNEFQTE